MEKKLRKPRSKTWMATLFNLPEWLTSLMGAAAPPAPRQDDTMGAAPPNPPLPISQGENLQKDMTLLPNKATPTQVSIDTIMNEWGFRFFRGQWELCPTTNRKHLQCHMEFQVPITLMQLQNTFGMNAGHFEMVRNPKNSENYTRKLTTKIAEGLEWGKTTTQGQRTDIQELTQRITRGDSIRSLCLDHQLQGTALKYIRHLRDFQQSMSTFPRHHEMEVIILTGPPGVGKTRRAYELDPDLYSWDTALRPHWWDGYIGQKTVLIDEYEPQELRTSYINNLLDRYPMRIPVKGSSLDFCSNCIIIISNHPFKDFRWTKSNIRRVTRVEEVDEDGNWKEIQFKLE